MRRDLVVAARICVSLAEPAVPRSLKIPTPSPAEQGAVIAEQLRTLAAELDRQGRPEYVTTLFEAGRSEGLKALQETGRRFLERIDCLRDTLRGVTHDAVTPYRAPILKILKAVEGAADVTLARRPAGPAKDDGAWMLAQRVTLLPDHYRTLAADYGKVLNDLASEIAAGMSEAPHAPRGRSRTPRRGR